MNLAIIPARGGSKRILRKNMREFNGNPIISYSIAAARESGLYDKVIVSTDDEEIRKLAESYGAEVNSLRPPELSDDHVGLLDVMRHEVLDAQFRGFSPKYVCCIYATAPLIQAADIKAGFLRLSRENFDYVLSVAEYSSSVFRSFMPSDEGGLKMLFPQHFSARSQDLPKAYYDAAQFCWGSAEAWIEKKIPFNSFTGMVVLPSSRVQDIDNEEDWRRAEILYRILNDEKLGK
jgi:pseudaminic acid cytidylyltransferase